MIETIFVWIPESLVHRVTSALLHFFWQGLLLGLILAAVLRYLGDRHSGDNRVSRANQRYLCSCAVLLLMLILPVINFIMISPSSIVATDEIISPDEYSKSLDVADGAESFQSYAEFELDELGSYSYSNASKPIAIGTQLKANGFFSKIFTSTQFTASRQFALRWFFLFWLVGVAFLSVWHVIGWCLTQRYTRQGESPPQRVILLVQKLAEQMGVHRAISIRQTTRLAGPAVMGLLKPVLIVPASVITRLTSSELEAVIAHELAHVKRHDYIVNLMQSFVETLLFYHPIVWWVSRRIRIEREFCTDDMAIRVCTGREVYVKSLVSIAELTKSSPQHALAATGGSLLVRVRRLLQHEDPLRRSGLLRRSALAGIMAILFLTVIFTTFKQNKADSSEASAQKDKIITEAEKSENSLAVAVKALNKQAAVHPESATAKPITVQKVVDAINALTKPSSLSDEEYESLQRIAEDRIFPDNFKLRQFVRYDTGSLMHHGRWVRLMIRRNDRGPFSLHVQSEIAFERPYTLMERLARDEIRRNGGGVLTLGRFISHFKKNPQFSKQAKQTIDYSPLVTRVKKAIEERDTQGLIDLFHWAGVNENDSVRAFVRRELEALIKRGVSKVEFEAKKYVGDLYQWQGFRTYASNLPVEGYLRITYAEKQKHEPDSLWLEVGSAGGIPKFVCHMVDLDKSKTMIGKKLSGPITSSGFTVQLDDNWLEHGFTIEAPEELKILEQANLELWKRPYPENSQLVLDSALVESQLLKGNKKEEQQNNSPEEKLSAEAGPLKKLLDRIASKNKGPFGSGKLHKTDDNGNIVELELKRAEFESGDIRLIGKLTTLVRLDLLYSNFSDADAAHLSGLKNLRELRLFGTKITDAAIVHLSGLEKLERLDLSDTAITNASISGLKELKNLRHLAVSRCPITDVGIEEISKLKSLESLKLSETKVTDAAVSHLKSLSSLRSVTLYDTKITETGINELTQQPQLSWLENPEAAIKEIAHRMEAEDFHAANDLLAIGLQMPKRGKFKLLKVNALPQTAKDKRQNRSRFELKMSWLHPPDSIDDILRAELSINSGAIHVNTLGIEDKGNE